ncbi:GOLD domain [Arabidopsis thaliana x Arabidopsis arenosa]|uniref:GOLD domain n=1 Tax=Arabidopsis thaliana x Arabidopsis arenosa TaxID=1240361 RepID=A0A8T2BGU8_9BRAS|nr:GOLD domain [Arabidopsis thaliana x Arabidopsis arenosa]
MLASTSTGIIGCSRVEIELKKLDGAVEAIHENLIYLRNREAEVRIVSEKTNSRVAWYRIMSLGLCITEFVLEAIL